MGSILVRTYWPLVVAILFSGVSRFDPEEKKVVRPLLDIMIHRHEATRPARDGVRATSGPALDYYLMCQ